jgi:uncharacterized protein
MLKNKSSLSTTFRPIIALFLLTTIFTNCTIKKHMQEITHTIAFRLNPNEDLKAAIEKMVIDNNIDAGYIITAVGSLTDYNIRFANQAQGSTGKGHFEIVSLVGTLSKEGSHIHISLSDSTGKTIGGHLLEKNLIYTTAEIVIGYTNKYKFTRKEDGTTPWKELQVETKK